VTAGESPNIESPRIDEVPAATEGASSIRIQLLLVTLCENELLELFAGAFVNFIRLGGLKKRKDERASKTES
jgi:hypothetical protein